MSTLNEADLQKIQDMRILARNGDIGYWEIYQFLADKLVSDYNYDWKDSTILWLRGATQANKGEGAFSDLIRGYTNTQYQLRYKEVLSDEKMQEASNKVAENLIRDLLGEGEYIRGTVPAIEVIAKADAPGVGFILFNGDKEDTPAEKKANSAWSGTLLFEILTSDQTYRLVSTGDTQKIDTLADLRDVLFAHQSYSAGVQSAVINSTGRFLIDAALLYATRGFSSAIQIAQMLGLTNQYDIQTMTDIAIMGSTVINYINSPKTAKDLWSAVTDGTSNPTIQTMFRLIGDTSPAIFLDMLRGSKAGKAMLGQTTSQNFADAAYHFFNDFNGTEIGAIKAELLDLDTLRSHALPDTPLLFNSNTRFGYSSTICM
jgi:serralysin